MQIDVARQLGAVTREVRAGERDGSPTRTIVAGQTYATTAEDLWDAVTNAERIPRWFAPVSGELKLGGRYQITGNAGGEILECEPPRRFMVTWEFAGAVSWVELRIEAAGHDRAILTLEHTQPTGKHWDDFGAGATGVGWDMALAGLDRHLSTGQSNDPAAGMAWMMSDEGKTFSRQSGEAWGAAGVAGGEDPAAEKDKIARTIAAYTGA